MSKSKALVCLLYIAAFCTASFAVTADRVTGPLGGGPTVALKGNVHRQALPEYDAGPADPAMRLGSITLLTVPTAEQQKALSKLITDQQNPKSPQYHKWLTPEQWADRFGLSQNDMQQITSWLKARGFTIQNVARGRNWVVVSGTAAQVARTFGTEIHRYNVKGEMHVANATSPKIPAALSGIVTGIRGLNDFHLRPRAKARPSYYFSDSQYAAQFIAPGDLATIYDINALYKASTVIDGTGQKLAIIGQTDIYLSDITDFRTGFGLAAISCSTNTNGVITSCNDPHFSYVVADGLTDPGVPLTGDLSEADLDIEMSGAVARGAQIVYVNAPLNNSVNPPTGGVWEAWYYAVDQNLAPVISLSYGTCEFGDNNVLTSSGTAGADEIELQKANSEGITFVNSTGDSGVAECETTTSLINPGQLATMGLGLGYPASSPEVTGVGGTAIPLANFGSNYWTQTNGTDGNSVANGYIPEQGWNDDLEFFEDCESGGALNGQPFCTGGNNTGTAITSEATAQNAIGISSSGGGPSNCAQQTSDNSSCVAGFQKPSWQTVTLSGQPSVRYSPDVSFLATPNFPGYIYCTQLTELGFPTGTVGSACGSGGPTGISGALSLTLNGKPDPPIIGGTSASAPIFAGVIALMNQYLLANADISTAGLGNVNPTLYKVALTSSNGAFNKVNVGDNNVYCSPGTPIGMPSTVVCPTTGVFGFSASTSDATTGYNLVTGLGSVDVNKLAVAWDGTFVIFSVAPSQSSLSVAAGQPTSPTTITITPIKNFSGNATYSCPSGLPTGATCSFTTVSPTSSTLVINTAANMAAASNVAVTVQATDTPSGASKTTTVSLTVTATTESFALASNLGSNATLSVTPGQTSGAVNLTVSSSSTPSFVANSQTALPLTYSCSGLPSESTCNFSPSSTSSQTSVTLTITTTAPTGKLQNPLTRGTGFFYAVLFPGLVGIAVTIGGRRRSLSAMRMLVLITLLSLSALWMASCGGSSSSNSNPGTPAGSYPVTVSATTGGASPIQNSFKFTLSVQ